MLIIQNRFIPFGKHFYAINLFGIVFAKYRLSPDERRHEYIHTMQQRELLFLGFYIIYILEWFVRLVCLHRLSDAYMNISFEREAYAKMGDPDYTKHRKMFAWANYIS
jgi:hypothetical protein